MSLWDGFASYPDQPELGYWFCHSYSADSIGLNYDPIYLHPPTKTAQKKPLTDEEINKMTTPTKIWIQTGLI
jgi:hypothetical protein